MEKKRRNKDEFSMTKAELKTSNSQQNLMSLDYMKINTRTNFTHYLNKRGNNKSNSLPKLPDNLKASDKHISQNSIINNNNLINFNNSNSTTLINYCDKKKLSFYKGANISLSTFFLDANKTISTGAEFKNTSSVIFNKLKIKKSKELPYRRKKMINEEEPYKEKIVINKKVDEIKSTLNPNLDITKLIYKTTITAIRNKYSILFNKEYMLFHDFIPSLYTLKFDYETIFFLNQLHDRILCCTKYLSSVFLDQDIESFRINEKNLEKILVNLLELFIFNNKINRCLIKRSKQLKVETNRERQNKKEIKDVVTQNKVRDLQKILESREETIRQIRNEKFLEHNDYIINMKKLRDEQNDLVKLLKKNMEYFNMYKSSLNEIKAKDNVISQQKLDYNNMVDKNYLEKMQLEEDIIELKDYIKPIQEENEIIKGKNKEMEEKMDCVDEVMRKKNQVIYSLQENLRMKDEEIITYINKYEKIKEENDKLSDNLATLMHKYDSLSTQKYGFTQFDYDDKKIKGNK